MTLTGTEAAIPGVPSRRRRFVVIAAVVALLAGIALVVLLMTKASRDDTLAQADLSSRAADSRARATTTPQTPHSGAAPVNGGHPDSQPALTSNKGKLLPSSSASTHVPSSRASSSTSAAPEVPSSSPAPSASPAPPPAPTTASVPTPTAPSSVPPAPPAPEVFDADRAYAVVGFVDAQGAREPAVKASLRQVNLTGCYRTSLKTTGVRATGFATLTISFDETGRARSAIFRGSGFARDMASCIQSSASGIQIPKTQVDPGGGTATANLEFRAP